MSELGTLTGPNIGHPTRQTTLYKSRHEGTSKTVFGGGGQLLFKRIKRGTKQKLSTFREKIISPAQV